MAQSNIQKKIINFFTQLENPKDSDIHKFADWLDIKPDELENEIYKILSSFLYHGRFNESVKANKNLKINKKELEMGIKVEYEHTNNELIARRIALDHLTELYDYYTRLKKMEEK